MSTHSFTTNYVPSDPSQAFKLDVEFSNGTFSWSVRSLPTSTYNNERNNIYGLTVNIGGNSYYKGDIPWGNYSPGVVVYSGSTALSACTITNGVVTVSVSGNYYYGTWSSQYNAHTTGTIPVAPPVISGFASTIQSGGYNNKSISYRSTLRFTVTASSGSGGTINNYYLYQDNLLISSGSSNEIDITAPDPGDHTYFVIVTDTNGTAAQSTDLTVKSWSYIAPSFTSVTSTRWSSGSSSGTSSDTGTYARLTATWEPAKIGDDPITTSGEVKIRSFTGTLANSGDAVYTGNILNADNSYPVTYNLYDDYIGNNTPSATTSDSISIGGRGVDLTYDPTTTSYGVAVGAKAEAGYFDSGLPTRLQGVYYGNTSVPNSEYYHTGGTISEAVSRKYIGLGNWIGDGYCKIATITINSTYADFPIIFAITGRSVPYTIVNILFDRAGSKDPTLNSFTADNYTNFFLYKTATSTWELYGQAVGSNGTFTVLDYRIDSNLGGSKISVEFNFESVNSLPVGYIAANSPLAIQAFTPSISRTSGWTLNSSSGYLYGKVVQLSLVFNASGTYSVGSNIFVGTLNSYKPIGSVMGSGYWDSSVYTMWITPAGAINVRLSGYAQSYTFSSTATTSVTYLTE